jgi:hypothetical protein
MLILCCQTDRWFRSRYKSNWILQASDPLHQVAPTNTCRAHWLGRLTHTSHPPTTLSESSYWFAGDSHSSRVLGHHCFPWVLVFSVTGDTVIVEGSGTRYLLACHTPSLNTFVTAFFLHWEPKKWGVSVIYRMDPGPGQILGSIARMRKTHR